MKGPSTLTLFVAVVGSGLVGMLVYAGLFYSNARRTIPASSEMDSSLFQSREKAENAANEWISLGGIFVVETLTMIRRMVPVTALEKEKLKTQNDQAMRRKIEAKYSVCLDNAETDLAKELCSFGPRNVIATNDAVIPQKKTIENQIVKKIDYQRRECTDDQELRSFECIELDVARDAVVRGLDDDEAIPIKAFKQFRY